MASKQQQSTAHPQPAANDAVMAQMQRRIKELEEQHKVAAKAHSARLKIAGDEESVMLGEKQRLEARHTPPSTPTYSAVEE